MHKHTGFSPLALSNHSTSVHSEAMKREEVGICTESGAWDFTPLEFAVTESMGKAVTVTYVRILPS